MKPLHLMLFALLISGRVSGQVVVYDPTRHATDVANQLQNLAQYIEMVTNQVTQINTMTQQLQQMTAYVQAFGDPAMLLHVIGADQLIQSLNQSGVGQTIGELRELASGVAALKYNAEGLYQSVGETFTTFEGMEIPRAEELYKKFSAIDQTAINYRSVYDDVMSRRQQLQTQLSNTVRQLEAATSDAETQKLTGVIAGQGVQLEALDNEIDFAVSEAFVQDIENRNDEERQQQARTEEQQAEFSESMKNSTTVFKLEITVPNFFQGQ